MEAAEVLGRDVSMQSVLRVAYLVRDGKCTGIRANTMECLCYALGGYCFYKGAEPEVADCADADAP